MPSRNTSDDTVPDRPGRTLHDAFAPLQATPQRVFEVADANPVVKAILDRWLNTELPWDRALILMVVELSRQLEVTQQAFHDLLRQTQQQPGP